MSTEAKFVELDRDLKRLEQARRDPAKSKLRPRDKIRIACAAGCAAGPAPSIASSASAASASATWPATG